MSHTTSNIMMVRPANFGFNPETAENNVFQSNDRGPSVEAIRLKAIEEFDNMVMVLTNKGVNVEVIEDTNDPIKPDALFPNNWISFHKSGSVITYPMYAENRRIERREEIIEKIAEKYKAGRRYTFEHYEEDNLFLEGTGSMLFDRDRNIVYACLSQRTDPQILDKFCVLNNSQKVVFHAVDRNGLPIYHTNVMMALGEDFAVLCTESVVKDDERKILLNKLKETGKDLIDITYDQMNAFAGNMLQVRNDVGDTFLVMSQTAYNSLEIGQIDQLKAKTSLLPIDIDTIEYYGGGSVRCMMAEIFLPKK